jgi:hypothetical protein
MSKVTFWMAAWALTLAIAAYAGTTDSSTFRGEIADSQCALNVHSLTRSHQEMLKSKSMGGNSASCALYCVRYMGGNFVLTTRKRVYHLDNQDLAQKFVGMNVKINGTLDSKSDTIHINKIESAE